MTPQTKWHDHALDEIKTTNQAQQITKDRKKKTSNKYYDSIPMGSQCLQEKANPRLLQDFMAISFHAIPASYFHKHITVNT